MGASSLSRPPGLQQFLSPRFPATLRFDFRSYRLLWNRRVSCHVYCRAYIEYCCARVFCGGLCYLRSCHMRPNFYRMPKATTLCVGNARYTPRAPPRVWFSFGQPTISQPPRSPMTLVHPVRLYRRIARPRDDPINRPRRRDGDPHHVLLQAARVHPRGLLREQRAQRPGDQRGNPGACLSFPPSFLPSVPSVLFSIFCQLQQQYRRCDISLLSLFLCLLVRCCLGCFLRVCSLLIFSFREAPGDELQAKERRGEQWQQGLGVGVMTL